MKHHVRVAAVVIVGALVFAACGGGSDGSSKRSQTSATTGKVEQPAAATMPASADVVATAVAAGEFTTLVKALQAAGLVDTLKGTGPFTVFAPTDAAFAKLPPGTLDQLLASPEQLKHVLLYHVVAGQAVKAADVVKLTSVPTAAGEPVTVTTINGSVTLNNTSTVTKADIAATNGVIHVIDTVLIPPTT
jgi:uncharacterized surface protein with fasciclin (FAS1) repeats